MVSAVSFRGALDSSKDLINMPQVHQKPQAPQQQPQAKGPKKHKHVFLKALATAAVIAGALVAGSKLGGFSKLVEKGTAEGAGKVAQFIGKGAGYLDVAGNAIAKFGVNCFNKVKGLIKPEAATPTV